MPDKTGYFSVVRTLYPCVFFTLILSSFFGCSSEPKRSSKYPPRQPGCEVQLFTETPTYDTVDIGTVQARCDETVSDADCVRELKDQACKLGADTVWGVEDPTLDLGKKKISGRAAHQK
jgi:hypothetical protein